MDLIRLLRGEIRRSVHGPAWHGPALLEAVSDVKTKEAFAKPLPSAHSIAELTVHSAAWMEEVLRRLSGVAPAMPARGDWPTRMNRTAGGWNEMRDLVRTAAEALDVALGEFPASRLLHTVGGDVHDAPLGSGVRYIVMLNGVVQHNVYHAGQIVLLKQAQRSA